MRNALLPLLLVPFLSCAQSTVGTTNVLTLIPIDRTPLAKAGSTLEAKLNFELRTGYHVNSNKPAEEYLIPLRLTWNASPLGAGEVTYPKPLMERYSFSKVPLSVYSGEFSLSTSFAVPASTPPGPVTLTGKLRYQACNDRMCLPPKNLDVKLEVEVAK